MLQNVFEPLVTTPKFNETYVKFSENDVGANEDYQTCESFYQSIYRRSIKLNFEKLVVKQGLSFRK